MPALLHAIPRRDRLPLAPQPQRRRVARARGLGAPQFARLAARSRLGRGDREREVQLRQAGRGSGRRAGARSACAVQHREGGAAGVGVGVVRRGQDQQRAEVVRLLRPCRPGSRTERPIQQRVEAAVAVRVAVVPYACGRRDPGPVEQRHELVGGLGTEQPARLRLDVRPDRDVADRRGPRPAAARRERREVGELPAGALPDSGCQRVTRRRRVGLAGRDERACHWKRDQQDDARGDNRIRAMVVPSAAPAQGWELRRTLARRLSGTSLHAQRQAATSTGPRTNMGERVQARFAAWQSVRQRRLQAPVRPASRSAQGSWSAFKVRTSPDTFQV